MIKNETTRKLSWFGWAQERINGLKGPSWVWYALLSIVLLGIGVIIRGVSDGFSKITIEPITFLALFQFAYVLSLIDFLDKQATSALKTFYPLLKSPDEDSKLLAEKLTYLPPKIINRITLFVLIFFLILGYLVFADVALSEGELSPSTSSFTHTPFGYFSYLNFSILWLINAIFIYHTIRQIKAISYAFAKCTEVNLFDQTGLYSFTKLGASTGIGLVLSSPVWLLLDPGMISLIINIVFSLGAIFIFIIPLIGIHNLLTRQKTQALSENRKRKEEIIRELYASVEAKQFSKAKDLEAALSAVKLAQEEVRKISTWPWDTETIRRLGGAIIFPISIWLIQFFLSRLLVA